MTAASNMEQHGIPKRKKNKHLKNVNATAVNKYNDGLEHKGAMSTKPVFEKIAKIRPVMWTYDICAFDTGTYYDYY